jgi:nucleoside-diphosphate-sugar epimerase
MNKERNYDMSKDMLIVITGAGGFIGGNLAKYFSDQGLTRIRAVVRNQFASGLARDWCRELLPRLR